MHTYPFGRPLTPRPPSANGTRSVFVLGAYPSALHVEWTPPAPYRAIRAVPVDDEPTPFWDGGDQEDRVARWISSVAFDPEWGRVRANAQYNGPCGQKLLAMLFEPLGIASRDVWITDCLDTYRGSIGVAKRIADTYSPWATSAGAALALLPSHPSETEIVVEALRDHRARLLDELAIARPDTIITLGNAALRVVRELANDSGPRKLSTDGYGIERPVRLSGRLVRWLPLAHPAAPPAYLVAHDRWIGRTAR